MNFESYIQCPALVHQKHEEESRRFLVGLLNGMWLSAVLTGIVYLAVRATLGV